MKKSYLKLKIKLISLVVVILLIGCGVLTYQRADEIRTAYRFSARSYSNMHVIVRDYISQGGEDLIQQIYYQYASVWRYTDMGFYSMFKNVKTDETLAEDQKCIIVGKESGEPDEEDMRVLLLGNEFGKDRYGNDEGDNGQWQLMNSLISEIEIIGTCDDTYIYLEELKWKDSFGIASYSYTPNEMQSDDTQTTVSFEEWAGSRYWGTEAEDKFYVCIGPIGEAYDDWSREMELDNEAKDICKQIYADYADGTDTMDDQSDDGLFTCYVAGTGYINDEYAMPYVFVFHPVSIAMEELTGVYVVAALIGGAIILFIVSVINKVYNQQLAYENSRRDLTRGIAHELKTPLAVTKGYVENWAYLDENERQESSKIMIAEIDHMTKMVTDLLELSHFEAKVKKLNPEDVDIFTLTKTVLGRMKSVIDERQLVVRMTPEDATEDAYVVKADLEMMRVALTNFMSNAVKYAQKDIDISVSEYKGSVKFIITNDGKTIDNDKLDRVWDEFYKSESANDSRIGSSGLGLAITKNILILHDAKYGCENSIGKTTFWFEIKK